MCINFLMCYYLDAINFQKKFYIIFKKFYIIFKKKFKKKIFEKKLFEKNYLKKKYFKKIEKNSYTNHLSNEK